MHDFKSDFYGHNMKVVVLGYIRPELDYTSRGKNVIHPIRGSTILNNIVSLRGTYRRH
jgi:hypothetical protein